MSKGHDQYKWLACACAAVTAATPLALSRWCAAGCADAPASGMLAARGEPASATHPPFPPPPPTPPFPPKPLPLTLPPVNALPPLPDAKRPGGSVWSAPVADTRGCW
eukprot:355425-Chlamydomonas_euryale.AAC.10